MPCRWRWPATGGDLVFVQNVAKPTPWCRSQAAVVAPALPVRGCRIRDWHYDGISVNPMPANNGAYLDFGPQDYKVHLFGALFRYEL